MKQYLLRMPLLLLFAALAVDASAAHQTPTTGRVVDPDGTAVAYATVVLLDAETQLAGTATAADGSFSLKVPAGRYRLTIQYLGYETLTRDVDTPGDLGEFDKDGWLYIKGRLKNMIVGPGGENIYPEDIETVLNSHVYIADSIVTEQEGRLVALVHFNRDEIEAMVDNWREEWETQKEAWEAKTEQLKKEIMDFVNAKATASRGFRRWSRKRMILQRLRRTRSNGSCITGKRTTTNSSGNSLTENLKPNDKTTPLSGGALLIPVLSGRKMRRAICRSSGRAGRGCLP